MLNSTIRKARTDLADMKWLFFILGLVALLAMATVIDPGVSIPATGAEQFLEAIPAVPEA